MCLYVHLCVHACMYVHVYLHICVHVCIYVCTCVFATGIPTVAFAVTAAAVVLMKCVTEVWDQLHETENTKWIAYSDGSR